MNPQEPQDTKKLASDIRGALLQGQSFGIIMISIGGFALLLGKLLEGTTLVLTGIALNNIFSEFKRRQGIQETAVTSPVQPAIQPAPQDIPAAASAVQVPLPQEVPVAPVVEAPPPAPEVLAPVETPPPVQQQAGKVKSEHQFLLFGKPVSIEALLTQYGFAIIGAASFVLAFGYFIYYAIEQGWITHMMRALMTYGVALLLIAGGWFAHTREKFRTWGITLFAAGTALAYYMTFAIHHFPEYNAVFQIPLPVDLALLTLIALGTAALAWVKNSRVLLVLSWLYVGLTHVLFRELHTGAILYLFIFFAGIGYIAARKQWSEVKSIVAILGFGILLLGYQARLVVSGDIHLLLLVLFLGGLGLLALDRETKTPWRNGWILAGYIGISLGFLLTSGVYHLVTVFAPFWVYTLIGALLMLTVTCWKILRHEEPVYIEDALLYLSALQLCASIANGFEMNVGLTFALIGLLFGLLYKNMPRAALRYISLFFGFFSPLLLGATYSNVWSSVIPPSAATLPAGATIPTLLLVTVSLGCLFYYCQPRDKGPLQHIYGGIILIPLVTLLYALSPVLGSATTLVGALLGLYAAYALSHRDLHLFWPGALLYLLMAGKMATYDATMLESLGLATIATIPVTALIGTGIALLGMGTYVLSARRNEQLPHPDMLFSIAVISGIFTLAAAFSLQPSGWQVLIMMSPMLLLLFAPAKHLLCRLLIHVFGILTLLVLVTGVDWTAERLDFLTLMPRFVLGAAFFYGLGIFFSRRRLDNHDNLARILYPVGATLMLVQLLAGTLESFWLSIAFALLGSTLMIIGFHSPWRLIRLHGLILLILTILKVYISDIALLEPLHKIIAFLILGILLLVLSFMATTYRDRFKELF